MAYEVPATTTPLYDLDTSEFLEQLDGLCGPNRIQSGLGRDITKLPLKGGIDRRGRKLIEQTTRKFVEVGPGHGCGSPAGWLPKC